MKVFVVAAEPRDDAPYLREMLTAFGFIFHERCSLSHALAQAQSSQDVIVLSNIKEWAGIEEFLRAGGNVLAIFPDTTLETLVGLKRLSEKNGPSRLRFTAPMCPGARGEALWTLGARRIYESLPDAPESEEIAYSFQSADPTPPVPGIREYSVGAGRLVIYAYDLAQSVARLRQGFPERADFLPPGQETPRAAFLQTPNPPPDTFWRPTADLHALAFCEIVKRLLERSTPVPMLWHLPHGAPSILLFSGDEDAAPRIADEAEMQDIEAFGAAMNLYIFPGDTSLSKDDIAEFARRGHTVSAHPFLSKTAGQSPQIQLAQAESQVRLFHEKFDAPVRTVRNHSYMWPGYVELPELWEKLGIGMDCNSTSIMRGDSPEWGPFAKLNSALPLRFVREDGTLIDVFQQPTQINDDQMSHPTSEKCHRFSLGEADAMMSRVLDDAIRVDHSPVCVNFHPGNYFLFSAAPARAILGRARALNLPIWSIDCWHNFWRARSQWRSESLAWNNGCLEFQLHGERCEGMSVHLPLIHGGCALSGVLLNSAKASWETVLRRGREVAQIMLPANEVSVKVRAEYSP